MGDEPGIPLSKDWLVAPRVIIAAALFIATLLAILLILLATDTALSVWSRLRETPAWLQLAYGLLLTAIATAAYLLIWRVLRPRRKEARKEKHLTREIDAATLESEILDASAAGIDVKATLQELEEQRKRKSGGKLHLAVCGEVSSGKSSLVSSILPDAQIATDPRAGTTTEATRYRWRAPSGDTVIVTDLPGFNLEDDEGAREECIRAHLVIFLCDADLTASEAAQIRHLQGFGKPLILALNKSDRYSADERRMLLDRLARNAALESEDVVAISASQNDVGDLLQRIQTHLDREPELMESLRDSAVLLLASRKLNVARLAHRDRKAADLVRRYSKRAVIGALAAVAPGSDLLIQTVLATQLLRALSSVYEVPVRDIEIDSFLQLAEGKVRNMTAITLAISGNALKAFPGLGTITGGLVHAVAYGMIFDSLGRAAARTMASRGELRPMPAARTFEELMHDNLESRVVRFARLAVEEKKPGDN